MSGLLRSIALAALFLLAGHALHAQNCTINAGVTTSVCPNDKFILSGSSSGLIAVDPVWSQISGPAVTIKNPDNLHTEVAGYTAGNTYKFRLSAKCVDGSLIYDEVTYNTYPATIANAGTDISVCAPGTLLHANTPGTGETGTWTIEGDANGISFNAANINQPNLAITSDPEKAGKATLRWTINSSNSCRSFDDIVVTNPGGVMPVYAGDNQTLSNCYTTTQSANLHATFGGNGTNGQQGTWSVLSGPTVPVFNDPHDNEAVASNLTVGTYKLRWTVTGPCANGVSDIVLTVPVGVQSVTRAKDASAVFCDGRNTTIITGLTPAYAGETLTWSRVSGTGDIVSPNAPTTEIRNLTGVKSVFSYTISNPATGCNTTANYTINYTSPPSITAPSPVIAPCNTTLVTVNYNYTGGDKTQWALISAPAGVSTTDFKDAGQPLLLPPYTIPGTYLVRLKRTTDNGFGGCQDQYADVYVQLSQAPTAANAGTRQVLACNVIETHLAGNLPAIGTGSWSQVSGPNIANIIDKKDPTTLINGLENGTYTFRWIITGGVGCPNQQADVQVVVSDRNPTAAAAGQDITICNSSPYKLQGNRPALNESGLWTVTPTAGVIFSDPNDPTPTVNGLAPNTSYTFTWTMKNSCGQSSASVHITTSAIAGPQQANAGPDQCLPAGTTALTLAGNTPANGETGKWNLVAGSNLTFTNATLPNTGVTGATNGNYQLEWTLSRNGCPDTRDTVLYTISGPATTAAAGSNQNLCGAASITLNGNAPSTGVGHWSQEQGPGGIIITNPALNNTTVSNLSDGRYAFRWTISNGACAANFSEVTFNITTPPTQADAGPDKTICGATTATLEGNIITNGIGTWGLVSGPSNPTFANPSDPKTTVSNLKTGIYKLQWTANSGPDCPISTDEVVLTVRENAKVQTATQQLCNSTSTVVSGNEGSIGTWQQTAGPAGTTIAANAGNAAVISNMMPGNTYQFTYTIAEAAGCEASSATTTVTTSELPSAADAGPDQQFCLPSGQSTLSTSLAAVAPAKGVGTWTLDTKPAGTTDPVIKNPSLRTTAVENLQPGIYVFSWTVSNGYCTSNTDIIRIVVSAEPSEPQPEADQPNACTDNILLKAVPPTSGIGTWTIQSAPDGSTAVIDGINAPSTKVAGAKVGQYIFRWTVSNGNICEAKYKDITVNVTSMPPNPAVANRDNLVDGKQCILTGTTTSIQLNANTPQLTETGKWTITHANGSAAAVTFDADNPTTTVTNIEPGDYLMRWTIYSGSCTSISDLLVTVYARPTTASAGANTDICLYAPLTLAANIPSVGTGKWSIENTPGAMPDLSSTTDPAASVSGLVAGNYKFKWTISNGVCPASSNDVVIRVDDCGIKVIKTASTPELNSDGSYNVSFTFKLTNPGSIVTIDSVQLTDYIPAGLPANATYTVEGHTITGIDGYYNDSFDGNSDINLLVPNTASLAPGATATITITIKVKFFK